MVEKLIGIGLSLAGQLVILRIDPDPRSDCLITMRVHTWSCLWLFELSACIALSVGAGNSKDLDKVIFNPLIDTNQSQTHSERDLQASDSPGTGRVASRDGTGEERWFLHELSYKAAGLINIHPLTLYKLFGLEAADGISDKGLQRIKWSQYAADYQAKHGPDRFTDSEVYDLLSKSNTNKELLDLFFELHDRKLPRQFGTNMLAYMLNASHTRKATLDALLLARWKPEQVFLLIRSSSMDLKEDLFREWLKYTELYWNQVVGKRADDVVVNQEFLYPISKMLMTKHDYEDLVALFASATSSPDIANIGRELETIVKQEYHIATALKMPTPPSPEEFARSLNLVATKNDKFLQWLRYCDQYSKDLIDRVKRLSSSRITHLMVLDVMEEMTSIDELLPLLRSVQEAPELQKFVTEMVEVVTQEQLLLTVKIPPLELFKQLPVSRLESSMAQWFHFLTKYHPAEISAVKMIHLRDNDIADRLPDFNHVMAVYFESLKNYDYIQPIVSHLQAEVFNGFMQGGKIPDQLIKEVDDLEFSDLEPDVINMIKNYRTFYAQHQLNDK